MDPVLLNELMYERGRGPELRRVRLTVFDLIPYLEHADYSDARMLELWPITAEELTALKQYIADHHDEVMAMRRRNDERVERQIEAQRQSPEMQEKFRQAHENFLLYKEFVEELKSSGKFERRPWPETQAMFRQWLEQRAVVDGVRGS